MFDKIDYSFLAALEGGSKTSGYVPAAGVSKKRGNDWHWFRFGAAQRIGFKELAVANRADCNTKALFRQEGERRTGCLGQGSVNDYSDAS